jgi:hypothetical protein
MAPRRCRVFLHFFHWKVSGFIGLNYRSEAVGAAFRTSGVFMKSPFGFYSWLDKGKNWGLQTQ